MKEQEVSRYPGVPPTPIEEEALRERGEGSEPKNPQNDRRRAITSHHAKDMF